MKFSRSRAILMAASLAACSSSPEATPATTTNEYAPRIISSPGELAVGTCFMIMKDGSRHDAHTSHGPEKEWFKVEKMGKGTLDMTIIVDLYGVTTPVGTITHSYKEMGVSNNPDLYAVEVDCVVGDGPLQATTKA